MRHAATYRGARRNYARWHGFLNQWRTFDMLWLDQRKSKQVVHQSFIEARNQTGWRNDTDRQQLPRATDV